MTRALLLVGLLCACDSRAEHWQGGGKTSPSEQTLALSYKRLWEPNWPASWRLLDFATKGVDHGEVGFVLRWQRLEGSLRTVRTDAFSKDGSFLWGSDEISDGGSVRYRGAVFLERGVGLRYRNLVEMSSDGKPNEKPRPLAFRLEIYDHGRLVSVYRSQDTFLVSQEELSVKRAPEDAVLVFGAQAPEVERAKRQ